MSKPSSIILLALGVALWSLGLHAQELESGAPGSAEKKAYSEGQYEFLRRRYPPNQPEADAALSGSRLQLQVRWTRANMLPDRHLWPVVKAVIDGDASALESRIDAGLSPDSKVAMGYPLDCDISLLDIAIQAGQRDVIKLLLRRGATVNPPDEVAADGTPLGPQAPLPLAASYGEDDVVRLLLQKGANIDQILRFPHFHETALAAAVYAQDVSTVYLLLTHGANVISAFGPDGSLPEVLRQEPMSTARLIALRNLLMEYGAKMPLEPAPQSPKDKSAAHYAAAAKRMHEHDEAVIAQMPVNYRDCVLPVLVHVMRQAAGARNHLYVEVFGHDVDAHLQAALAQNGIVVDPYSAMPKWGVEWGIPAPVPGASPSLHRVDPTHTPYWGFSVGDITEISPGRYTVGAGYRCGSLCGGRGLYALKVAGKRCVVTSMRPMGSF